MLLTSARIMAAKPHSADVERCISANNLLKTSLRSALNLRTESSYLFVYNNLPPTAEWNPRPAVLNWLMKKHRRHSTQISPDNSCTFVTFSAKRVEHVTMKITLRRTQMMPTVKFQTVMCPVSVNSLVRKEQRYTSRPNNESFDIL